MAAVSYTLSVGQPLESVVVAANAPSAGSVEIRLDQTTTVITDPGSTTGTRAPRKSELLQLIDIIKQQIIRDLTLQE